MKTKINFHVLQGSDPEWALFFNQTAIQQKLLFQIMDLPTFNATFKYIPNHVIPLVSGNHTLALIQLNHYKQSPLLIPEILTFLTSHKNPSRILRILFQYLHRQGFKNVIFPNAILHPKDFTKLQDTLLIRHLFTNTWFTSDSRIPTLPPHQILIANVPS